MFDQYAIAMMCARFDSSCDGCPHWMFFWKLAPFTPDDLKKALKQAEDLNWPTPVDYFEYKGEWIICARVPMDHIILTDRLDNQEKSRIFNMIANEYEADGWVHLVRGSL